MIAHYHKSYIKLFDFDGGMWHNKASLTVQKIKHNNDKNAIIKIVHYNCK